MECTKEWFNGPEWLLYDKQKRSKNIYLYRNEDKDEEADVGEIQKGKGTVAYFSKNESKIKSKDFRIESVIDPKRFSKFDQASQNNRLCSQIY